MNKKTEATFTDFRSTEIMQIYLDVLKMAGIKN